MPQTQHSVAASVLTLVQKHVHASGSTGSGAGGGGGAGAGRGRFAGGGLAHVRDDVVRVRMSDAGDVASSRGVHTPSPTWTSW